MALVVVPGSGVSRTQSCRDGALVQAEKGPHERAGRGQSSPCWYLPHLRGAAEGQTRGPETTTHKDMLETEATSPREASGTTTMRLEYPEPSKSSSLSTPWFQGLWSPQVAGKGSVHPLYTVLASQAGRQTGESVREPYRPWHLGGTEANQICCSGHSASWGGWSWTGSNGGLSLESRMLGFCHSPEIPHQLTSHPKS